MKLQARDQRITELNKQILKLKEDMREQVGETVPVFIEFVRPYADHSLFV